LIPKANIQIQDPFEDWQLLLTVPKVSTGIQSTLGEGIKSYAAEKSLSARAVDKHYGAVIDLLSN